VQRMSWTTLMVAALGLGACTDATAPNQGVRFSMYLTDAPGDVRAWVSFSDIYLQGGEGRTSLLEAPTDLIELTALVGVVQELVGGAVLPLSTAGQLRAVVHQAVLEDGDGNVYSLGGAVHPEGLPTKGDLRCPSCTQSGLKVRLSHEYDEVVLDAEAATLLLDFDVSQSFGRGRSNGKTSSWTMHPVNIGTLTLGEASEGEDILPQGMIRGAVQPPFFTPVPDCPPGTPRNLSSFIPVAEMAGMTDELGNPLVRTGSTSTNGIFEIPFLGGGEYTLGNAPVDFDTHRLVFNASVIPGIVTVGENQVVGGVTYYVSSMACEAF